MPSLWLISGPSSRTLQTIALPGLERYAEAFEPARLTVVYEPTQPGCKGCWQAAGLALRRFRAEYPAALVLVALPPELRVHPDLAASGRLVASTRRPGERTAVMGWLTAFDATGRQLLARALTGRALEEATVFQELEASYSLTRLLSETQAP